MTLFKELEKLVNKIEYLVLLDFNLNCIWWEDGDSVYWNTDDSKQDLANHEGNTYSAELFEGSHIQDGVFICNGNNGCGQTITYFFSMDKEVDIDELGVSEDEE